MAVTIVDITEDAVACVSCAQPSDTSTPDDADMCWKCFGEFNASCVDEMKCAVTSVQANIEKAKEFIGGIIVTRGYGQEPYDRLCNALRELDKVK